MASIEYYGPRMSLLKINRLMTRSFFVDYDIKSKKIYEDAILKGFKPEMWEQKNKHCRVLVEGKHYKDIE